jgi:hypothetical protein
MSLITVWIVLAFVAWLLLIPVLERLGVPEPILIGAVLSWLLGWLLVSHLPQLVRLAGTLLRAA